MIPFDFDYYRPDTLVEAAHAFDELNRQNRSPIYYGGGTEIITMARTDNIHTQAVIDLKNIPECRVLEIRDDKLIIGAGVTLTQITESRIYTLLVKACGRIADHTVQGKITIGGNICGTIIYRETSLPLLLTDSEAVVAGINGTRRVPFREIFRERINLGSGEFLVQLIISQDYLELPYIHVKKTKNEKIDYPLVSLAAIKKDGKIRIGLSGVCSFPFRSVELEEALNNRSKSPEERVSDALMHLPAPILDNGVGSAQFREYVLGNTLLNALTTLEEAE
ncbi:FAD binding domain-containing protein [Dehalobacterium formicoaceticum]|uniref:FAD binding domain-containing protein n=1 Tax=Dehalobacterium formicoaceticum TaxID=51515 RepID=A0ABT1Y2R9_9FIRM|nr:FAD binding domain-containing protein [Dehalobacterium formicoaceticum]MCR6544853.1 FAD binding domain-containing protein [Dehalobacterium formicoaceticum]